MNAYLDASAMVSLWIRDEHYSVLRRWHSDVRPELTVSDFGAAEFVSAGSLRVRTDQSDLSDILGAIRDFERSRLGRSAIGVAPADIRATIDILTLFDLALRAPDALHIAICRRIGATLVTFDDRQLRAAIALGVPVVEFARA